MRLKSFHARSMSAALQLVRETLGDEAIIVASREDETTGGVRVTAAIEDDYLPAAPGGSTPPPRPSPGPRFGRADGNDGAEEGYPLDAGDDRDDVVEQINDALLRNGVPPRVAEALIAQVEALDSDDPVMALAGALDAVFTFLPLGEATGRGEALMMVGPAGAGKTMVVAKLAARGALKGRRIGVVTTDTVRAGGVEQLAAFTRLLKLDLLETEDKATLGDGLHALHGSGQILIDTAGRNPFSETDLAQLADLSKAGDIEPVLVMAAGGDASEAGLIGKIFRALGCRRVVLTRLDATRRLGSVLSVAYEAGLAFSDVSLTPGVADGLQPLNPVALARLLLPRVEQATETIRPRGGVTKQTGTY